MESLPRSRHRSPHAVSVAELLCRYETAPAIPRPRTASDPTASNRAEPVPVSTLLRREGRARRALDRPLVPRGHSRPAPAPAGPPLHGARKATVAAGALFVVGAVFGAGVLEEALLRPDTGAEAADGLAGGGSTGIGARADGERGAGPGVTLASTAALLPAVDQPPVTGADIGAAALLPGLAIPGPVSAAPGAVTPAAPAAPAPVGAGPAGPAPAGPGATVPGPGPPPVTVGLPDLSAPPVEVPGIALPPTPLGTVATPSISLTRAAAVTLDLTVALDEDGVAVGSTDTALVSPDAALGALDAGPVGLTGTDATVGDLRIEGAEVLRVGPEPEVTVPSVTLTPTTLETPDLRPGGTVVEVPDLALPELSTPEVPVVETVTGLLGAPSGGEGASGDSPLAVAEDVPLVGGLLG